jgi:hypothetical protein
MKKGNFYPRARARWASKVVPTGAQNCPAWVEITDLYAVYIYNDDGTPVPQVLSAAACSRAKYSYDPYTGEVVYLGTWDDVLFTGQWRFKQKSSWDYQSTNEFRLTRFVVGTTSDITYTNVPSIDNGIWPSVGVRELQLTTRTDGDLGWLLVLYAWLRPMTYARLRAVGEDPDDTAPLTWNYTA